MNGGVQQPKKLVHATGARGRGQNHKTSMTKTISTIFIPNFVCVLTNKNIKYIERIFWSDAWVMPQRWDLGAQGLNCFEQGHVAYQFYGNDA